MNAVDTNILVRLLTDDDPKQTAEATAVFADGPIWIAKTVLLETEWVLRKLYGFEEHAIRDRFTQLLGLRNVYVEDELSVTAALALAAKGVDFADAMHVSSRPPGAHFVTFDRALVRGAKRAGVPGVSAPPLIS
jgi:predicted nucleic-acid-binding protein